MRRMSVQDWELSNLVMGSCHRPEYRYKRKKQFQGHRKHRETDILKKSHEKLIIKQYDTPLMAISTIFFLKQNEEDE